MARRYKKATAPLDETARARLWEGRWSELSLAEEDSADLGELVDSFYDKEEEVGEREHERERRRMIGGQGNGDWRQSLTAVLAESREDSVADRIRVEAEKVVTRLASGDGDVRFKMRVVRQLREKGFDAGLCKSSWERTEGVPAGHHQYIDVIAGDGARYIVEVDLAGEFGIARPTSSYAALLRALPKVFVGSPGVLKAVVRVMCVAAKDSIRSAGMDMPPWRRREFVQMKWFSFYKRTTDRSRRRRTG